MDNTYRPFSLFPPVVKNLLIVTAIVFLAQTIFENIYHINLSDYFGLHYYKGELFKPHQFITYIFLHADFRHILFNMLAVWMFGASLEHYWGSKKFLIFYLLTGLGAALAQYIVFYFQTHELFDLIAAFNANPTEIGYKEVLASGIEKGVFKDPGDQFINSSQKIALGLDAFNKYVSEYSDALTVIGASGSLFGLLGAYGMIFPNNVINIYFFIPIKAKYFVILYGVIELFLGLRNSSGDNVAHFAHLGGLIVGVLILLFWKKK
jgi:membrane associated rhomboid family serine protease